MDQQNLLKKQHQVAVLAASAMVLSVFLYGGVVFLLQRSWDTPSGPGNPVLKPAVFSGAVLNVLMIPFLKGLILKNNLSAGSEAPKNPEDWAPRLFTASILGFALSELPSIIGLALCLMTQNARDYWPFAALSLSAFALHFPRYSEWERRAATLY